MERRKTNGKRNRAAGHQYERDVAKMFRAMGFEFVQTSRACAPLRDKIGIDLANEDELKNGRLPYNIQLKSLSKAANYLQLLEGIPEEPGQINIVLHRATVRSKSRFFVSGEYAFLKQSDLLLLLYRIQSALNYLKEPNGNTEYYSKIKELLTCPTLPNPKTELP